jgi:hypothetical protein
MSVNRSSVVGVWWKDWAYQKDTPDMSIEDHSAEIVLANKIGYIENNFQGALNNDDAAKWYVTFCNADALGLQPNDQVMKMAGDDLPVAVNLRKEGKVGNYGAVFLDKPSETLIKNLYTISLQTLPNLANPSVNYQTIPWLRDYGADVSHVYAQNNTVYLNVSGTPGGRPLKKIEVIHEPGYGIINFRFSVIEDNDIVWADPFTSNVCGASQSPCQEAIGQGWMGTDFDGTYLCISNPTATIVHISAGYQPRYGIVNVMVAYSDASIPPSPLTPYQSNDMIWSPLISASEDLRFISTWRQDGYGIVDVQSSLYV